jgi:hypothetical protein
VNVGKLFRIFLAAGLAVGAIALVIILIAVGKAGRNDVGQVRHLPDGSTLSLRRTVFTSTNYNYSHQGGNRFLRMVAPILPPGIRSKVDLSSGSFGFGSDGNTNLFVISVLHYPKSRLAGSSMQAGRLRVVDDQGDEYDACWGANTLGMQSEVVHGWQVRAFPRRSRMLGLQFLAPSPKGGWTNAAEFQIPNPAYADYPQWTPDPLPTTKSDGPLTVTLGKFQSGGVMSGSRGSGPASTAARKTRLVFSFTEDGAASTNWMVQKVTISDATGNKWFPYLDFVRQDFNWAKDGTVEFLGALWPGERAWKLEVEAVRKGGFRPEEMWEIPLDLPAARAVNSLTNWWEREGLRLKLVGLASPNVDHPGDFKWVAKWWGEDKNRVYSLAMQLEGDLKGWRASVVGAVDQTGSKVKIMQHGSQDYPKQAVFLRPNDESTQVRLTLALQRSRFVEFLARPEFVRESDTNRMSDVKL